MSDHHDGIEEHDNHLPNWWLVTLFGSILFSFVYWTYYHTLSAGAAQAEELQQDEAALQALREKNAPSASDESLLALSKDEKAVARGRDIFKINCVACHGMKAEGSVGPNLTDAYWMHGGAPTQIQTVIAKGVPEKGMLAWNSVLGAAKVNDVTAFLITLKGTNVQGKGPQGEKEPGAEVDP
jgi:cytochrome c oxidase cbb3-type subunit III